MNGLMHYSGKFAFWPTVQPTDRLTRHMNKYIYAMHTSMRERKSSQHIATIRHTLIFQLQVISSPFTFILTISYLLRVFSCWAHKCCISCPKVVYAIFAVQHARPRARRSNFLLNFIAQVESNVRYIQIWFVASILCDMCAVHNWM